MNSNLKRITIAGYLILVLTFFPISFLIAQLVPNLGGQRTGISAFQFLKIGVGARGVALGETFVAIANDASTLYWNPAGLTQFSDNQIIATHTEYVVDIKHEFIGLAYHISSSDAIGFAITSLHMDDMEITTETHPMGTGKYFSFGDIAFAGTYSRKMTDQFSFGLSVRYVQETLDILKMRGIMVDLGTFYWTGLGSARFAVVVSNFGPDVAPKGEVTLYSGEKINNFQSFSPPTAFKIGFAMEPFKTEDQQLTSVIELQHPNDNAENIHLGLEYSWYDILFLRSGVKRTIGQSLFKADQNSSTDLTLGFGFKIPVSFSVITFDYAYANFNLLGSVHRISLGMTF